MESSHSSHRNKKETKVYPPERSKVEKSALKSAKTEKNEKNRWKKFIMDNLILILTLAAVCMGIGLGIILRKYELSDQTGIALVMLLQPGSSNQSQTGNGTALINQNRQNKVTTTDAMLDVVRNIFAANIDQAFLQTAKTDYKKEDCFSRHNVTFDWEILQVPELMGLVTKLEWFMLTIVIGFSIHWIITLNLLYNIFARRNPFKFIKAMIPAYVTAVATASSAVTLPVTRECTEKTLGIQKAVTRFVLPVGATINMDGMALYGAVAVIFIAQLNKIDLSIGQLVTISLTATLTSIGAAAVPTVGMIAIIMILQSVGLPVEDISLLLTVDWLLERYRTVTNITGDAIGAAIVDRYVNTEDADEPNNPTESETEDLGEGIKHQGK